MAFAVVADENATSFAVDLSGRAEVEIYGFRWELTGPETVGPVDVQGLHEPPPGQPPQPTPF